KGRRRRDHDYDVDVQANHLSGKFRKSLGATLCVSALNDEVLALHVTALLEPIEQRIIKSFMPMGDKAHPPNFSRLLRSRRQRRCRGAAEESEEVASLHDHPPCIFKCVRVPLGHLTAFTQRLASLSHTQPAAEGLPSPWGKPELF